MNPPVHRSFRWHRPAAFVLATLFMLAVLIGTSQAVGELDQTFGGGGKVLTDFSSKFDVGYDIAIQSDGKMVVVGQSNAFDNASYDFALARYDTNGSLDATFGTNGKVITDFASSTDGAQSRFSYLHLVISSRKEQL